MKMTPSLITLGVHFTCLFYHRTNRKWNSKTILVFHFSLYFILVYHFELHHISILLNYMPHHHIEPKTSWSPKGCHNHLNIYWKRPAACLWSRPAYCQHDLFMPIYMEFMHIFKLKQINKSRWIDYICECQNLCISKNHLGNVLMSSQVDECTHTNYYYNPH